MSTKMAHRQHRVQQPPSEPEFVVADCVLRIYLVRRTIPAPRRDWLHRIFAKPLAHTLVKSALRSGVPYALVTLGHCGYVAGAKQIVTSSPELELETLPTCVELVGDEPTLTTFVREHEADLAGAILFWLSGSRAKPLAVYPDDKAGDSASVEHRRSIM